MSFMTHWRDTQSGVLPILLARIRMTLMTYHGLPHDLAESSPLVRTEPQL